MRKAAICENKLITKRFPRSAQTLAPLQGTKGRKGKKMGKEIKEEKGSERRRPRRRKNDFRGVPSRPASNGEGSGVSLTAVPGNRHGAAGLPGKSTGEKSRSEGVGFTHPVP